MAIHHTSQEDRGGARLFLYLNHHFSQLTHLMVGLRYQLETHLLSLRRAHVCLFPLILTSLLFCLFYTSTELPCPHLSYYIDQSKRERWLYFRSYHTHCLADITSHQNKQSRIVDVLSDVSVCQAHTVSCIHYLTEIALEKWALYTREVYNLWMWYVVVFMYCKVMYRCKHIFTEQVSTKQV